MEMSKVIKCEVDDCAYNLSSTCNARAITVGHGATPRCDTFCQSMMKGGDAESLASVGACKVSLCMYNSVLECQSPGICVGYNAGEPDCLTFQAK